MSSSDESGKLSRFVWVAYVICAIVSYSYFAGHRDGRLALVWGLFVMLAAARLIEDFVCMCIKGCKRIYVNLGVMAVIALLVFYVFTNQLQVYVSTTPSMEPTIYTENIMIVNTKAYLSDEPGRNDIALIKLANVIVPVGHRIIAGPNDTVEIEEGVVTVNAEPIDFEFLDNIWSETIELSEGEYYHKGDNSNSASGVISADQILGKVIYIAGGQGK